MSWRNTDRAFGSRARGLRGLPAGVSGVDGAGLAGFVAPGTVPIMRWRNTDRAWGNRARGLPNTGPTGWGLRGIGQALDTSGTSSDIIDVLGPNAPYLPPGAITPGPVDTTGGAYSAVPYYSPDITGTTSPAGTVPTSTGQTIQNIAQAGFQDAYNILKLLNPVPPGTVMQTTPYGTYISRAAAGQPTPAAAPFGTSAGSSMGLLLLVGLGLAVFAFAGKG